MTVQIEAIFPDKNIEYIEKPINSQFAFEPIPEGFRLASVKPRPRYAGGLSYAPDTAPMGNSTDDGVGKGAQIVIAKNVWKHHEFVNDKWGMLYCRGKGAMMINNDQNYSPDHLYETARSESLTCGCNIVIWDKKIGKHVRLFSINTETPTSELNTNKNNWYKKPWQYAKLQAVNSKMKFIKVYSGGVGADVYWIRVSNPNTELWMHEDYLEIWPEGYDYKTYGLNVYNGGLDKPLMLTDENGVRTFHNGFSINTPGVIPPKDWPAKLEYLKGIGAS